MSETNRGRIAPSPPNGDRARKPGHRPNGEEVALIRSTLMSPRGREPSDEEVALFLRQIERSGLDPFARQIYVVYRYSRRRRREEMSIETTIDGLRLIAERSGRYEGQTRVTWCGEDGAWRESWPESEPPVAATVGVYKRGAREPTWGTAHFREYAEFWADSGRAKGFYETMPRNQIAKCAEALALRKAFPAELSGLYAAEEMVGENAATMVEAKPPEGPERSGRQAAAGDGRSLGGGMQALEARARAGAPAQLRQALRERAARAGLGDETVIKLAGLYLDESRLDRLGEEQVGRLTELVDLIGAGGIASATLKGQLTKAESHADREEARAVIRRWVLRRANEASANEGEPPGGREEAVRGETREPHGGAA